MTDQDEEPLAEWLFYRRKHRQRRVAHRTLSTTQNTDQEDKN